MILTNSINNIPSIASGGTVSFNLPVGVRMHGFDLFLSSSAVRTAVNSTNFQRLRVTVDSVVLIDWDWPSLQLYALRRGISLSLGQIPVMFSDPLLVGQRNWAAGSLDTKQGITNVQVFVQLGVVTAPSLVGELHFDFLANQAPRMVGGKRTMVNVNTPILKLQQNENIPLSSNYQITDIPTGYPLDTITLYNGADTQISFIRATLNKIVIWEGIPADIARRLLAYGVLTPIGAIVLPFTYDRFSPGSAAAFTEIAIMVNSAAAFTCGLAIETQLPSIS